MEFYEVINKRRSIRQFEDRAIAKDVLERILDAGLKAPSSNHQRQWELLTLTDKALIENTLLAATAEGLGSVVHIPVKTEPEKIKEFMKVPDGYYLPTLIMLGYPAKDALVPAQVKATVENKVRWNKW